MSLIYVLPVATQLEQKGLCTSLLLRLQKKRCVWQALPAGRLPMYRALVSGHVHLEKVGIAYTFQQKAAALDPCRE